MLRPIITSEISTTGISLLMIRAKHYMSQQTTVRYLLHLGRLVTIMPAKRVVFVIVEGPTDEDALGVIFQRYFDKNTVRVKVIHGDITTERNVNPSNILNHITEVVQQSLKEYKLHKTDLLRVIHLADTDGAFIPDSSIFFDKQAINPVYSTTYIKTTNPSGLIQRNQQKRTNLSKLHSTQYVWKDIPYSIFYLSSNLEHALYNELNLTDEEKEAKALQFAKKYINDIPAFIDFVCNSDFSVINDYLDSWLFIEQNLHSLERHSNIGLCFSEKRTSDI